MATIRDWQEDLEKKSIKELENLRKSFYFLRKWELFEKEYSEMELIRIMIRGELEIKNL